MKWLSENWFRAGLLVAIFVAGISVAYYFVLFTPQQEEAKLDQQRRELLVQQKIECAELRPTVESRIAEQYNDETRFAWLEKIFYSQKQNSCVYTMHIQSRTLDPVIELHILFDALTGEGIIEERGCLPKDDCGKSLTEALGDFLRRIEEYE